MARRGKRAALRWSLEVTRPRQVLLFLMALCTFVLLCYLTPERTTRPSFVCDEEPNSSGPVPDQRQVLVVSYPRSGSSFLGDLLQSPRTSFYYFEPLHYYGKAVPPDHLPETPAFLQKLLRCEVPGDFLRWVWDHGDYHTLRRSWHLWAACEPLQTCYDLCFLRAFCRNQTLAVAKTIRLPLQTALQVGPSVVHLVRDPRATMHSRADATIATWCGRDPTCYSARRHCELVLADLNAACRQDSRGPPYRLVRYEDLALDPSGVARELFTFLGERLPAETDRFLASHTRSEAAATSPTFLSRPYTTARNSTSAAFAWADRMKPARILEVQDVCGEVIRRLGYPLISSTNPLSSRTLVEYVRTHPVQDYCKSFSANK